MPVTSLAYRINVFATSTVQDFFYTQPAVMAMTSAIHVAASCISFSGSGTIDAWVQISNDLENWRFLGASPGGGQLFTFSAVAAQQASVAPGATAPYNVPVGALWVRVVFRGTTTGAVSGTFAVRVNTFVG